MVCQHLIQQKCRVTMQATQRKRVVKVSVKHKTREQRLIEEPCCPVCLEDLTDETLCNPATCHNICVDCRPVCNKCPLCRKGWKKARPPRRRCEGGCENMTLRKCSGFQYNTAICEKYVCIKCRTCEGCASDCENYWKGIIFQFTNNPLYRPRV